MLPIVDFCASELSFGSAISRGCDISETWLDLRSMVVAFIRFARNRSSSGLMVRSSVETWYQHGFVLHAAAVVLPVGSASAPRP